MITFITPANKTIDRTPRIGWSYIAYQNGYKVRVQTDEATPTVYEDASVIIGASKVNRYHDVSNPLEYGSYIAAACVLDPDFHWVGDLPYSQTGSVAIEELYRPAGDSSVLVTCGATHGLIAGNFVLIADAGPYFDGFFKVASAQGGPTFSYTYDYGPYTTPVETAGATGWASRAATMAFQVVPAQEHRIQYQENRATPLDEDSSAISSITGATRTDNIVTVALDGPHGLRENDPVMIQGLTYTSQLDGIYRVATIIDDYQFSYYSSGPNTGGSGGRVYDFGFEDYAAQTDIDISDNSERLKIDALGQFYAAQGYIILRRDSQVAGTEWGYVGFDSDLATNTSIFVQARASEDIATLDAMTDDEGWGSVLYSGDQLELSGRYIDLKVTLQSSDLYNTPTLRALHVAFRLPATADEIKVKEWSSFSVMDGDLTLVRNTANILYEGSGAIALAHERDVPTYAESGYIILRQDAFGLNNWVNIELDAEIPAVTVGTGPQITVYPRFYVKEAARDDTPWEAGQAFTAGSVSQILSTPRNDKRFGEYKIVFEPSSDYAVTPTLHKVYIRWQKVVEGAARYLYTSVIRCPADLQSIIVTPNLEDVDGTEVLFGVAFDGSVDFENGYQVIDYNALNEAILSAGPDARIGVKLFSGATVGTPILHEFGVQLNTENHDVFFPNKDDLA